MARSHCTALPGASALLLLVGLASLAGCGSSSAAPASPGDDAGDDADAAALNPNGDPPACASPGQPSSHPPALADLAGVLDASGDALLVFGGDAAVPVCGMPPAQHQFTAGTYVLDVGCGTWTHVTASPSPSARGRQAMALDPGADRAVLFGGRFSPSGETYTTYSDVWTFDFATSAWSKVQTSGTGPSGRANSAAVVDGAAHRLVLFGGNTSTDGASFAPQSDTWSLDLDSGAWTQIATSGPHPPGRQFHAMAIDRDARVAYLFAGAGANAFFGPFFSDVWALDLASDTWKQVSTTGTGPGGRIEGALAFDQTNRRLVAFGGHDDGTIGNENDVFVLDVTRSPAVWTKLPGGDTPGAGMPTGQCTFPANFTNVDKQSPERRGAFAYGPRIDGRGFAVFGGAGDCGNIADSWWWSDGSQRWINVDASPVGLTCPRVQTNCKGLCG